MGAGAGVEGWGGGRGVAEERRIRRKAKKGVGWGRWGERGEVGSSRSLTMNEN